MTEYDTEVILFFRFSQLTMITNYELTYNIVLLLLIRIRIQENCYFFPVPPFFWIHKVQHNYALMFENRVSKYKDLFYFLAIKSNTIRPKAD